MQIKDAITEKVERSRDQLLDSVTRFIKIRSVEGPPARGKPFGEKVDEALGYALDLASGLGFKTRKLDGYIGFAEYGEGDELLGVLTHVDVVPEGKLEDWEFPPFAGIIDNGLLHGRGSVDDKGPLVSVLYGLSAVRNLELPVSKRVRVLFGTNEESGWGGIKYYLDHEEMPSSGFSPDGMFTVVNREKGITVAALKKRFHESQRRGIHLRSLSGGSVPNMVPDRAEAVLFVERSMRDVVLKLFEGFCREHSQYKIDLEEKEDEVLIWADGKAAHAMAPEQGANAIAQLLQFLSTLPSEGQAVFEFIRMLDTKVGMDWKDEMSGSLTLNMGTIRADETEGEVVLDIRSPVTYTCRQVVEALEAGFDGTGTKVVVRSIKEPLFVSPDHPLVETLAKVYTEATGRAPVLHAIGGGTYARAIKNCVCFGSVYPDEKVTAHQPNEQVTVEDLILNAKVYGQALFELLR